MADITKANDVEPTSQDKDKKKKKKRAIIGVTLGVATAGVVVAAVLGARGCSDTNVNVNYGVENMKQQSNKNIQISVPTGTTDMEGYIWHEEKDLAFNQETISQMNLDSNTIKLEQDKYDYRMNHSEIVADAHKMGKGTMTIDVYKKGTAPTAQKLSNNLADKASSDEAFDAPVTAKPLFTKTINLTVSFIGQDEATTNISDQLKDPKFSYPAGEVKDPIKAPITIPTDGNASASKDLTPDLGASLGLDIPVGSVLPTYTVKSDSKDHSVGTMTITNDGHTTDIKITSGITSTTVTTPKAPVAKTPEEIAAEKAATKAAEEKTKQDAITAAADKAKQDAADKLAAAASAKEAAKQATQDQLKALPVPTGFPTATDKTLPDYISAKTEFDTALADFNTAQANGDLDKAQDALDAAKTAKHEAETAITKAQQVKDNLDAELALLTPPKAPGTPTGAPTAEYTKAKADYDVALVDFNAKKAAFDLGGAKAAKVTAETVAATANKHLSADPSVVFAALGTMEALPTNMPAPIPADIQTLVDEYNAADTDFNALLATPDMANVDKATQDLKTGSVKVAAIKKLIADEAEIKALATPKTFPAELKTLPADFKAEETKYNAAKTAFDAAVTAKDPIEAKKQLLLLNAAADKATLLNTHVTGAIAALGALPTLPASTGKAGNERDEYNTAKTDYATAKTAFDAAIANDDVATATTSLADAETAVKLASANLDPKTMPVTVYTYDGKEYATQVLALAAAKTGEEAKIAEKTIYKLAGTTFDSKADADDALKAAADKTIKTQTWAAGTAPTDGSAAPAATVQDTVYVFNGQAFETEAQAQAAWLVANPGAPEVEGTFDVMYDGTKVKSFTIGSADKDKYKDEATALAEAKTKFAYVKDGATTGTAGTAEVIPAETAPANSGDIDVDGTSHSYHTAGDVTAASKVAANPGTDVSSRMKDILNAELAKTPGKKSIDFTVDGKTYTYTKEVVPTTTDTISTLLASTGLPALSFNVDGKEYVLLSHQSESPKVIGTRLKVWGPGAFDGNMQYYRDVLSGKHINTNTILDDAYVATDSYDDSKHGVVNKNTSYWGPKTISLVIDMLKDLKSSKYDADEYSKDILAAYKGEPDPHPENNYYQNLTKILSYFGTPNSFTKLSQLTKQMADLDMSLLDGFITKLESLKGDVIKMDKDDPNNLMGWNGSPLDDPQSQVNLLAMLFVNKAAIGNWDKQVTENVLTPNEYWAKEKLNYTENIIFGFFTDSGVIKSDKGDGLQVLPNVLTNDGEQKIYEVSGIKSRDGLNIKPSGLVNNAAPVPALSDADKTLILGKPAWHIGNQYITDPKKTPGYVPEAIVEKGTTTAYPFSGVYYKSTTGALAFTTKSDKDNEGFVAAVDTPAFPAKDGWYTGTGTSLTAYALPHLFIKSGKVLTDGEFVVDKTNAEGYAAAITESRVDKYKLQFEGTDVAGVTQDVKWTTSTAPTAPTLDETKVTVTGFKAYVAAVKVVAADAPSSAITQEAITAGIDSVKAAGDTGVDETTLTKVSGGFSGVVMDGKFYADQAGAETAYATAHASDITTEQIKTMFDGKDLKTEADATKAADAKAVTEVTSTSKDVPYVAASDEPLMVQTFTLDTTNIYA